VGGVVADLVGELVTGHEGQRGIGIDVEDDSPTVTRTTPGAGAHRSQEQPVEAVRDLGARDPHQEWLLAGRVEDQRVG
jgi:hypothetical protein